MKFVTSMICALLVITRVSGQSVTPDTGGATTPKPTAAAPPPVDLTNLSDQQTDVFEASATINQQFTEDMKDSSSAAYINVARETCAAATQAAVSGAKTACTVTSITPGSIVVAFKLYVIWTGPRQTLTPDTLKGSLTTALQTNLPGATVGAVEAKGQLVVTGLPTAIPTDKELIEANYMAVVAGGTYQTSYSDSSSADYTKQLNSLAKRTGHGYRSVKKQNAVALVMHTFSIPVTNGTTSMNQTVYIVKLQSVTVSQMEIYCKEALTEGGFTPRSVTISSIREQDSSAAKAICSPLLIISAVISLLCARFWVPNIFG